LLAITFDLSVLEFYFNHPRYICQNDDISGSISVSDEYYETSEMKSSDQFSFQTFGFAFTNDKKGVWLCI
jgi:hypothetical protein